jgi:hypothetical protein
MEHADFPLRHMRCGQGRPSLGNGYANSRKYVAEKIGVIEQTVSN